MAVKRIVAFSLMMSATLPAYGQADGGLIDPTGKRVSETLLTQSMIDALKSQQFVHIVDPCPDPKTYCNGPGALEQPK